MDGQQLRDARGRAQLTQEQLATKLGTTLRTVGNWERGTVPPNKVALVRSVLAEQLDVEGPSLSAASDIELLSELAKRLGRRAREDVMGNAEHPAATNLADRRGRLSQQEYDETVRAAAEAARTRTTPPRPDPQKSAGEECQDEGHVEPA